MSDFKNLIVFLLCCIPFFACAQQDKVSDLIQSAYKEQSSGASASRVLARWLQVYGTIQKKKEHPAFQEVCINIAKIYKQEELYEQAIPYYLQAHVSSKENGAFDYRSQSLYQQLAETYANLSKPDSAYFYYDHIFTFMEKSGNLNGQINILEKIVEAFILNKQYHKALDFNLQIRYLLENHQRPAKELVLIYNNLGYNYNHLKQYKESIFYFEQSLELLEKEDHAAQVILNINIGIAYYNLGQINTSVDYLLKARKIKNKHEPKSLDEIDQLLATVYLKKQDLHNALRYSDQSRALALSNHNDVLLTDVYYTTALIHSELYEYDIALDFFQKHLWLKDSFALQEKFRQQQLLQQQIDLERTEKQVKLFMINEDVKELMIEQLKIEAENQQLELEYKEAQLVTQQKEKELLQKENLIKASKLKTQELETQRARQELELAQQRLITSQQEKEVATLQQKEALQQLEIQNKEAQLVAEQKEKDILRRDKEISMLELQKQKERVQFFYGLGILLGLIILIVVGGLLYSRKLNKQLNLKNKAIEQQKEEISKERKKSDELLLNILPEQVAIELKDTGKAASKKYNNVTILFTDFKDFTVLVASIPAEKLVKELNDIFSRFDEIMEELQIEKIETIGDAYLAACGLPEENSDHALKCVKAAQQMLNYLNQRNKRSEIQWNMRVGIHSGPVVAGVVGKKKFAYDLFGDTVNTASRIESNGEAGKVNISQTTYELIKNNPTFKFENRGRIHAKGKGELEMWFVK